MLLHVVTDLPRPRPCNRVLRGSARIHGRGDDRGDLLGCGLTRVGAGGTVLDGFFGNRHNPVFSDAEVFQRQRDIETVKQAVDLSIKGFGRVSSSPIARAMSGVFSANTGALNCITAGRVTALVSP